MQRLQIHPENPQKRLVSKVAEVFDKDGLVVYPTDSGYSVGCLAHSKKAKQRLYQLKKDLAKYTMALMLYDFSEITHYAEVENAAFRYMKNKCPGPYTFILPATKEGTKILEVKRPEIGVRMPQHSFFETLVEFDQRPILNTSARIDDDHYLVEPDDIEKYYGKRIDMIVDMGPIPFEPTTIVSLVSGAPELIRQGQGEF